MKLKLFIITILFTLPFLLAAQAPGYLGKRAIIGLDFSATLALDGPTQNNRGREPYYEGNGELGINYEFEGSFEYVISRYRSLILTGGQYYTGLNHTTRTQSLANDLFNDFEFDQHELFMRLNVRSVSLLLSRYKRKKGALAPLGNRYYWGLKRNTVRSEIIDKRTRYWFEDLGPILGHADLEIGDKVTTYHLILGWSNSQIFWDKLVLKTGVRFGIPLNSGLLSDSVSSDEIAQDNYASDVKSRIGWHEALRFNLGLGYLIF